MMRYIVVILFCFGINLAYGQDPHFSQFYASPINLNPALTGIMPGQYRFNAMYRDQWRSVSVPFQTISASAEIRYNIVDQDFYSFGIRLLNDKAGESGFRQTSIQLSSAYMKQIVGGERDHFLTGGVNIGVGQNTMEWGSLWFGNQFDFDLLSENLNLPSGEPGILSNTGRTELYFDLGAGLTWFMLWGDHNSLTAGFSLQHINQPQVSFLNDQSVSLFQRYTGHINLELEAHDAFTIMPAALFQTQGPHQMLVIGAKVRFHEIDNAETAIRVGAWWRLASNVSNSFGSDAIILTTMYEFDRYLLGFSYDISLGSIGVANNRNGAFEFSLSYLFPFTERKFKVRCPKL